MGKVPYCGCSDNDGTATVANAIKNARLAVSLKDLISKDGWMYFTATFDPGSATSDEVAAAIRAGGGQVVAGLP